MTQPFDIFFKLKLKKAIDCLNIFSSVSGLCLNIKKCVLFPLKICNYNNILTGRLFKY